MWTAFGSLTLVVVLGYGGVKVMDSSTRLHRFFCTRCRRRAHYMQ